MVHKNIDIVPNYQCNKANNLLQVMRQWHSVYQAIRAVRVPILILDRSFRFLYSLLHNHDT